MNYSHFRVSLILFSRLAPIPTEHNVVRVPIHGNPVPTRRLFTAVRRGSMEQPMIAGGLAAIREMAARWRTSVVSA
ncbi:type 2 periplasmic-binding domain-containing protein [Salininema proteolyticum]|uniref:Uncharacterized protein n=1 Tax=Salininema proteolyticum TaxID=1607685 RepID=A0ABV8TYJ0_9ACTN